MTALMMEDSQPHPRRSSSSYDHDHDHPYHHYHEDHTNNTPRAMVSTSAASSSSSSIADMIVTVASAWNKLLLEHCSLCTLYCDRQVQFETGTTTSTTMMANQMMEEYNYYTSSLNYQSVLGDLFSQLDYCTPDPNATSGVKSELFDEASVVQSVSSRLEEYYDDDDDDDEQ